ncbi:hypothetical protein RFI_13906, partial [Reticulomyxa filosa]
RNKLNKHQACYKKISTIQNKFLQKKQTNTTQKKREHKKKLTGKAPKYLASHKKLACSQTFFKINRICLQIWYIFVFILYKTEFQNVEPAELSSVNNIMSTTPKNKRYEQLAFQLAAKDAKATRNEYFFEAPKWLSDMLQVKTKDLPLFYCHFNVLVLGLLNFLLLPWLYTSPWYVLAIISGIRIAMFGGRFILALHFSTHVPIIQPVWLNNILLEYVLSPMMGIPCGCYKNHHVVMHHKEDNIHPLDLSSTMPYRRDNFLHFLFYWLRFEIA